MQTPGPSLRVNSNAAFIFHPRIVNGIPTGGTLRPVRRAGDRVAMVNIILKIANELRRNIIRMVRNYRPGWNDSRIRNSVEGTLQMNNIQDRGQAHANHVLLKNLNSETILDMFELATGEGSNPDLNIFDVYWSYNIHRNTIEIGAVNDWINIDNLNGLSKFKWPKEDTREVSCGLIAFCFGYFQREPSLNFRKKTGITRSKDNLWFRDLCVQTSTKYGLVKSELTFNEILNLTLLFTEWRIVIVKINLLYLNQFSKHGCDYIINSDKSKDKTIYIYHCDKTNHYVGVSYVQVLFQSFRGHAWRFCHICLTAYSKTNICRCDGQERKHVQKTKKRQCNDCGEVYYWRGNKKFKHVCFATKCRFCLMYHSINSEDQDRCILYTDPSKFMKYFEADDIDISISEDGNEKEIYKLFFWDIESQMVLMEEETKEFEIDDQGNFILDENGDATNFIVKKSKQVPNLICYQNVFTKEKGEFDNMDDFLRFALTINAGKSIWLAHNSSGYDSRLLFDYAMKFNQNSGDIRPTFNGGRIMNLSIGKTRFQDSMLHLKGSLSSLAKGFGLSIEKGHFPHLLNKEDFLSFKGDIPEKKWFDLSHFKTEKEFEDFNQWHDEYQGVWDFQKEIRKYCRNDVEIGAEFCRIYHENSINLIGKNYPHLTISPWFFPTTAGYVHKMFLRNLHENSNIPPSIMSRDTLQFYAQTTWCSLEAEEHYFCKSALRGGRTNIKQYYYKGDIHYQDIQSSYPHVQLKYDYPVGTPIIEIFDKDYYPCNLHFLNPTEICECDLQVKMKYHRRRISVKFNEETNINLDETILNFNGIALVDIEPPKNLYHPVLIIFDPKKMKCIETLEFISKTCFVSPELKQAIRIGYKVKKIYRLDHYKMAKSKWRGLLGDMYKAKMRNSQEPPNEENQIRMKQTFWDKFEIDLDDFDEWTKNPVLKLCAKQPVTSAWGKHAETVDHPKCYIMNDNLDEGGKYFYEKVQTNRHIVKEFIFTEDRTLYKYIEGRENQRPDLHKGYLPAAVFVTSYARLELWEKLNKIDPQGTNSRRVLMYDTDSIIYISKKNEYKISEGDCLGDWETEDFEKKNNGIKEFVSFGPKSYAIKGGNGKEFLKCKGVCMKLAHEKLLNFKVAKQLLFDYKKISIPQFTFDYLKTRGLSGRYFLKYIKFDKKGVKGIYNEEEKRCYPYGFIQ